MKVSVGKGVQGAIEHVCILGIWLYGCCTFNVHLIISSRGAKSKMAEEGAQEGIPDTYTKRQNEKTVFQEKINLQRR